MMLFDLSAAFGSMLERLNPRERVLLGVMSFVALVMVCFLVILLTSRSLSRLEEQVAAQDELLVQLRESAPELRERLEAGSAADAEAAEPPALGTQLEAHASKAGMGDTVLEMVDQPEEVVGTYLRKSVEVRLRRKPLGQLSEFWALTVNDRAEYPVAITKLTVRRRQNEKNSYDVDMVVSSYWPNREPAPEKAGGRRGDSAPGKINGSRSKGRP
jgi:type II secretory pathway component PulM